MKHLIEEAEMWDLESELASLWWTSANASKEILELEGTEYLFEKSLKIPGYTFNQAGKTQDFLEGGTQYLVERCEDLQKQMCTVGNKMQKNGGACLQCFFLWKRKWVLESSHPGHD